MRHHCAHTYCYAAREVVVPFVPGRGRGLGPIRMALPIDCAWRWNACVLNGLRLTGAGAGRCRSVCRSGRRRGTGCCGVPRCSARYPWIARCAWAFNLRRDGSASRMFERGVAVTCVALNANTVRVAGWIPFVESPCPWIARCAFRSWFRACSEVQTKREPGTSRVRSYFLRRGWVGETFNSEPKAESRPEGDGRTEGNSEPKAESRPEGDGRTEGNVQPATLNLQPSTFNLQPSTFNLQTCNPGRRQC